MSLSKTIYLSKNINLFFSEIIIEFMLKKIVFNNYQKLINHFPLVRQRILPIRSLGRSFLQLLDVQIGSLGGQQRDVHQYRHSGALPGVHLQS
jgi:hypothetical protein